MTRRADLRDLDGREAVITASHVRKSYRGFTAVRDATFAVARGEIFGLLGPNGAGKTTTVECLQGLRQPDGGAIAVLGLDPVRQSRELRRRIGCQLQESALPDHIRVWEALELFAVAHARRARLARRHGANGASPTRARRPFHALSGGQRQRLFVALALVNGPEVVFLDEMTTGLDPAARRVAWDLIREIRERGTTVVLVTHFMEEAERLCDRIAVMDRGKVVALDSPRGLIAGHAAGLRVVFHTDADVSFLEGVRYVEAVRREGPRVVVEGRGAVLAHVAAALVAQTSRRPTCTSRRRASKTSFSASPATSWPNERARREQRARRRRPAPPRLGPRRPPHPRRPPAVVAAAAVPGRWALTFVKVLLRMTWIEIKLLVREPVTLVFSFAFPVLVLVLLGGIFGGQHMDSGAYAGLKMMDWYVPSYIGLVIASIGTVSLPVHLSTYRERGVLRRFRASGMSEWALLGSQFLVGHRHLPGRRPDHQRARHLRLRRGRAGLDRRAGGSPSSSAVFAFSALGVLIASLAPTARAAQGVGLLIWFIMMFISGTSAPLSELPAWMLALGKALPLYHVVISLVDPWNGYGVNLLQMTIVGGIGLATALMAAALFKWE